MIIYRGIRYVYLTMLIVTRFGETHIGYYEGEKSSMCDVGYTLYIQLSAMGVPTFLELIPPFLITETKIYFTMIKLTEEFDF